MAAADHLSPSPWRQHRLLWVIAAITLGLSLALAIDLTPWLRGPAGKWEWRWHYQPQGFYPARLSLSVLAIALIGGWYWLARRQAKVTAWLLAALVPLGIGLQLAILSNTPTGLQIVARVLNPAYFGYYPPATEIEDMAAFIDTYAVEQANFKHPRLQTHPPGNVVFEYVILKVVEAIPPLTAPFEPAIAARRASLPDWIDSYSNVEVVGGLASGATIILLSTLAVISLYLLARRNGSEEMARRCAVLYLLMPALTLFEPKIDVPYTLLSTLAYLLACLGLADRKLWLLYASGVLCSAGTFASYSLAPLSLAIGILVLGDGLAAWRQGTKTVQRIALEVAILAAGGITVQVLAALLYGYEPVQAYLIMRDETALYNTLRNYWYSLVYTPYDLLLFAGIPASILLVCQWARLIRRMAAREWPKRLDWITIGGTAAMALLTLSGIQKAENARVFLYFMPMMVLGGVKESVERDIPAGGFGVIAALTATQLLVFQLWLQVFL